MDRSFLSIFDMLFDNSSQDISYPRYDILYNETTENTVIELALAGFKKSELSIVEKNNVLVISGKKDKESKSEFVYKANKISHRDFTINYRMKQYDVIDAVTFEDGILKISLVQKVPEDKKDRIIMIG